MASSAGIVPGGSSVMMVVVVVVHDRHRRHADAGSTRSIGPITRR